VIEIYPKTRLRYWAALDTDRDGIVFIDDGTEFTGSFPSPQGISLQIRHDI
jgi:hypothetical protein